MRIETDRLVIRNLKIDDLEFLYEVLSNKKVMKYIEEPFTIEKTQEFIRGAGMKEQPLVYALEMKDTKILIGHVIFHEYDIDSFEIGWIINYNYWGLGIAQEATQMLIEYSKSNGINNLVIECESNQLISKYIALKYGFEFKEKRDNCDVYKVNLVIL